MKIIKLNVENIKRIVAVEITPDGTMVVIGGANAAGKTSLLDGIMYALAGGKTIPDHPIREGARKGKITVDLGEYIVERSFTPKSSYLTITGKDGQVFSSPQALLDGLVGSLSFDPLAFARMEPKKQHEVLKALVGLDFAEMDDKRAKAYEQRRQINVKLRDSEGALDKMPAQHPGVPDEEVDVTALLDDLRVRQEANKASEAAIRELSASHLDESRIEGQQADADKAVARCKRQLTDAQKVRSRLDKMLIDQQAMTAGMQTAVEAMPEQDEADIAEQVRKAGEVNQRVRENAARKAAAAGTFDASKKAEKLTDEIKKIDSRKAQMISDAPMPCDGLGFDDEAVTLNDLPLAQASSAEQLKLSVAMGLKMNPKLKVLLIRDGSLLDEDSLATIGAMASEADAQVWIERVGTGEEVSVVIEDGMVADGA